MGDEQVVKLLEEIRDLMRENAASYKRALQEQQEAGQRQLAMRKTALKLGKVRLGIIVALLLFVVFIYFVPILSWFFRWVVRR